MTNTIKEQVRKHEGDTGSSEVQLVTLTDDIKRLTEHLGVHKKYTGCRRSLLKKVATRKKFLKYLKNNDVASYKKMLDILELKTLK